MNYSLYLFLICFLLQSNTPSIQLNSTVGENKLTQLLTQYESGKQSPRQKNFQA